jgi:hypothetical protein
VTLNNVEYEPNLLVVFLSSFFAPFLLSIHIYPSSHHIRSAPFRVPWDKTPGRRRICSLNGPRNFVKTVRKPECMVFLTELLPSRTIYEQIRLTAMVQNFCKEYCPMVRETVHYGRFLHINFFFKASTGIIKNFNEINHIKSSRRQIL